MRLNELSEIGAAAKPPYFVLANAIKEDNLEIKKASLEALREIGPDADAVLALVAVLNDPDQDVQWRAADVLIKIGSVAAPALAACPPMIPIRCPAARHRCARKDRPGCRRRRTRHRRCPQ